MERDLSIEVLECANEQQLPEQSQTATTTAATDVFLSQKILAAATADDVVSDREVRELCGLPGSGMDSALVLIESTSSSPILNGTGIPQQLSDATTTTPAGAGGDGDAGFTSVHSGSVVSQSNNSNSLSAECVQVKSDWLNRVFVEEVEDRITASTPEDGKEEEELEDGSECGVVEVQQREEFEEETVGQEKSGLSRCLLGNLAAVGNTGGDTVECTAHDAAAVSGEQEKEQKQQQRKEETLATDAAAERGAIDGVDVELPKVEEEEECTCRDGELLEQRAHRQPKSTIKGDVENGDEELSSCCCGGEENACDEEEDEAESQLYVNGKSTAGHCDHHAIKNNFIGVQSEQVAAKQINSNVTICASSCESVSRNSNPLLATTAATESATTTASSSSSVIISREQFYSAISDSGGVASSLAKQQTPTSVRTASQVAGGGAGSFGKSEMQLENPKILSKRLQRLFQFSGSGDDDNDDCTVDGDGAGDPDANEMHVAEHEHDDDDDNDDEGQWEKEVEVVATAADKRDCRVSVGENKMIVKMKSASPAAVARDSCMVMDTSESRRDSCSGSSRAGSMEETPSTSMSSSLNVVRGEELDGVSKRCSAGRELEARNENAIERQDGVADREEIVQQEEVREGLAVVALPALVAAESAQSQQPQQDFEWADREEVGDESEEICTCQNYSDTEEYYDEDEQLPSKDVDLSGFTTHELLQDSASHPDGAVGSSSSSAANSSGPSGGNVTTPVGGGRKRKMSESACSGVNGGESPCGSNGGALVPLYGLDGVQSKRSRGGGGTGGGKYINLGSPKTPTSSSSCSMAIPSYLRTPRSAQSMHLMPKEHLPAEMIAWLLQFQKWTEVDRVAALNHLIDLCEPAQVRHVMKVIEPQFQRDFISLLPRELALQVLSYLEPMDLLRAAQTCRNWRFLCDDNLLWKEKCKEGNIIIDVESDRPKRGRAGNMPPIASPWKAAYMRQQIIELNWRSRPIRPPKVLKGHDDHVITCLQFCGNRIVSGSDDNTLKVWSAVTGKCLRVLVGHTGGVWSSQMSSKYIISGSTDRSLKVWNAETGHCEHTLYGHTSTVRCMHLHGEKVVSGSRDATLRVWDVNKGTCLHVLVGHLAAVRCVQYDGKLVVSGAYDYTVKVWNPERQECLHTLQGHTNRVYSLQFDGIHVVSGSLDTSIRVWDAETGSCKHTLMGHQSLTSGMELLDNILVSGNADSTVKIWDIVSGQCLQTLSGPNKHQSAVTCLQFNSRFVITSSDDGTVKLWDVRTGEFIRNLVALESGGSGGVVWRIRASDTKLICAVGSRNGTEETKLLVLDFDVEGACLKCS